MGQDDGSYSESLSDTASEDEEDIRPPKRAKKAVGKRTRANPMTPPEGSETEEEEGGAGPSWRKGRPGPKLKRNAKVGAENMHVSDNVKTCEESLFRLFLKFNCYALSFTFRP